MKLITTKGLAQSTLRNYRIIYNSHIKQALGNYKIVKLKYPILQKYFNNNASLSVGVQSNIKNVLNNVFKYACKCCYIENNPVSLVDLTGIKLEKKKKTITYQELETIVQALKSRRCHDSFKNDSMVISLYIGYYTGLRISEVLALEKSDFDFINNEIHVTKQLDCIGKRANEIRTTNTLKTNSSNAVVPLAEPLKC